MNTKHWQIKKNIRYFKMIIMNEYIQNIDKLLFLIFHQ